VCKPQRRMLLWDLSRRWDTLLFSSSAESWGFFCKWKDGEEGRIIFSNLVSYLNGTRHFLRPERKIYVWKEKYKTGQRCHEQIVSVLFECEYLATSWALNSRPTVGHGRYATFMFPP
jgi:hypothetical protein